MSVATAVLIPTLAFVGGALYGMGLARHPRSRLRLASKAATEWTAGVGIAFLAGMYVWVVVWVPIR